MSVCVCVCVGEQREKSWFRTEEGRERERVGSARRRTERVGSTRDNGAARNGAALHDSDTARQRNGKK